jgi:hypothetical protein
LGNLASRILASGSDWSVGDVVCSSGPRDRPFEEQHDSITIAVVIEGSFQDRAASAAETMSPGSVLLSSHGQTFECRQPFHFLRVFRQVAGVTPHRYVVWARLRDAALRLKTGRDSVLGIALDAGFRDLSHFNHAFRAEFGVSPARFRGGARGAWRSASV